MADVRVIEKGKKFVVLVNFIQRGVAYASREQAEHEAQKIKDKGIW